MGRPIKEKFFGNTNSPFHNVSRGGATGVGGEGFATVAILNTATNSGYSTSTTVTWSASSPQVPGGITAAGTANVQFIGGTGRIQSLNITTAGSGYTSTGSVTITFSPATGGTAATYAITGLTSNRQNALRGNAYLTTGSSAVLYDIMEQRSSRRYLVNTSQGRGIVKLVTTTTLTAGSMNLEATDANSNKYLVKKLTGRRAVLVRTTASGAWLFSTNQAAGWTLGTASTGTVSLANL